MKLEAAADGFGQAQVTSLPLERVADVWQTDWAPLLPMLTEGTMTQAERAARFHASLAHALLDQAMQLRQDNGVCDVGFTGGVFQNRLLTEQVEALLEKTGFQVHIPKQIPINDAGICLGQIMEFLSMQ